jgi:hypothetical protein
VEHGLHHVALALPEIALARHDSVAKQYLYAVEPDALGVVAMVSDEHALYVIRMIDDVRVRPAPRRKHTVDVAEAREQLGHPLQGVFRGADVELQLGLGRVAVSGVGSGHAGD